uniref:Receptor L-domain domain-containing protein n=1 Tax=Megaselia scalaris TaxID=36166 RepID=T1GS62_MEGSC
PGKRECLTKEECESRPGYFLDGLTCERGKKDTKNYCSGKIYLSTAEKIRELKYCSVINGSITIEIEDIRSNLIPELEENLMGITTIQGYLEVKNTPQITSLHFFKNLDTIVGNELLQGDIALYVVNNHYLEDIWYPNRKIQIQNGRLHFHLNPRLCYHKIKAFQPQLKSGENITIADVAPHSNGQETLCQEELELFVEIENYNSTAARIKLSPLIKERKTVHLGYLFYY